MKFKTPTSVILLLGIVVFSNSTFAQSVTRTYAANSCQVDQDLQTGRLIGRHLVEDDSLIPSTFFNVIIYCPIVRQKYGSAGARFHLYTEQLLEDSKITCTITSRQPNGSLVSTASDSVERNPGVEVLHVLTASVSSSAINGYYSLSCITAGVFKFHSYRVREF